MKFPLGKIIARFILRERSNKKRLEMTVCDEIMEQGFHGCTQKTIIRLRFRCGQYLFSERENFRDLRSQFQRKSVKNNKSE